LGPPAGLYYAVLRCKVGVALQDSEVWRILIWMSYEVRFLAARKEAGVSGDGTQKETSIDVALKCGMYKAQ